MHYDLIIIGMGLSGLMAAKTAVEAGQRVLIVGKGMGSLSLFSNTIDVLGNLPEGKTMNDGLFQWMKDRPQHPYSKVGMDIIKDALTSFTSLFPPAYSFQNIGDGNVFIPTGAGTLRPTYLIPITMIAGTFFKKGNTLIVGFKGFKDFYANYVADQLNCQGMTLSISDAFCQEITATAFARSMERKSFRETIGREIGENLYGVTQVGFPALLGLRDPWEVKKDLEEIIGAEVFEIPTLPPSIPGLRVFNRFKKWLIQKGVVFLLGHSVTKTVLKRKKCVGVEISNAPVFNSYSADHYILATGRYISGGLMADEDRIYEPIFNLPVVQPVSREDWFGKSFFTDLPHPVHCSGILVDSSLRPLSEKGEVVLENVCVAGSILAGHQCVDEKSREGIEIATGYMAAIKALEHGGKGYRD